MLTKKELQSFLIGEIQIGVLQKLVQRYPEFAELKKEVVSLSTMKNYLRNKDYIEQAKSILNKMIEIKGGK